MITILCWLLYTSIAVFIGMIFGADHLGNRTYFWRHLLIITFWPVLPLLLALSAVFPNSKLMDQIADYLEA